MCAVTSSGTFFFGNNFGGVFLSVLIKSELQVDMPVKIEERLGTGREKKHYVVYQIVITCTEKRRLCVLHGDPIFISASLSQNSCPAL